MSQVGNPLPCNPAATIWLVGPLGEHNCASDSYDTPTQLSVSKQANTHSLKDIPDMGSRTLVSGLLLQLECQSEILWTAGFGVFDCRYEEGGK